MHPVWLPIAGGVDIHIVWVVSDWRPITQNSAVVLFSIVDRFISLEATPSCACIERRVPLMLAFSLWATCFVLNELPSESKSVTVLIDGLLAQISFGTKVIWNVMVWVHVKWVVKTLAMSRLIGMSIATVVKLLIDWIGHGLGAHDPCMASRPRLLYHSVRWWELIVLHSFCYETRPPNYEELIIIQ